MLSIEGPSHTFDSFFTTTKREEGNDCLKWFAVDAKKIVDVVIFFRDM